MYILANWNLNVLLIIEGELSTVPSLQYCNWLAETEGRYIAHILYTYVILHEQSFLAYEDIYSREISKDLVHHDEEQGTNAIINHSSVVELLRVQTEVQQPNKKGKDDHRHRLIVKFNVRTIIHREYKVYIRMHA